MGHGVGGWIRWEMVAAVICVGKPAEIHSHVLLLSAPVVARATMCVRFSAGVQSMPSPPRLPPPYPASH